MMRHIFGLKGMLTAKNIYSLVLMVCALSGSLRGIAQSNYYIEDERTFIGGLVAGANFTQVDGDNFAGYHKVGMNVGGIVYTKLDQSFYLSLEILYSQKGSRSKGAQSLASGLNIIKYNINLNYAEVPVMINYFFDNKTNIGAGLSYSQLATSSEAITTYPPQNYNLENYPFKKGDLNILLGGSVHIWKGLFYNLRFQYSLLSIRDKIPTQDSKQAQFNNLWVMRLMYVFM